MARLIDAERLIVLIPSEEFNAKMAIACAPTVDAAPVVHGHWIAPNADPIDMMFMNPKCSKCGFESADHLNYCPHCGAKMD